MPLHRRECWSCKNVAEHKDNITPHVLCKKCGSQDTRAIQTSTEAESVAVEIALACATISPDDYWGILRAVEAVLDRFGIKHMQRPRSA